MAEIDDILQGRAERAAQVYQDAIDRGEHPAVAAELADMEAGYVLPPDPMRPDWDALGREELTTGMADSRDSAESPAAQ